MALLRLLHGVLRVHAKAPRKLIPGRFVSPDPEALLVFCQELIDLIQHTVGDCHMSTHNASSISDHVGVWAVEKDSAELHPGVFT